MSEGRADRTESRLREQATEATEQRGRLVGDLIDIARAPAVVSLSDVDGLRDRLGGGEGAEELGSLLAGYSLADSETRAAFEAITRSLGRDEARGDAFLVSGVYGSGKSHLLAAVTLLAGHPQESWPHFLRSHAGYDRIATRFSRSRLVVAIPLDEYSQTVSLEHIVLSRLEAELARRHGVRVALTEESHLLDLVEHYVAPQVGRELDEAARGASGSGWQELRGRDPAEAARVALEFITSSGFPLDWRRSRAEAWGVLRRALEEHGIDGPLMLLDELGLFLAGKDRRGLNADASFLQYLAQRTSGERCWLACVTQRGLEEVGDVDRRTLRQLRDRFRPSFTLGLAELGWVVRNRLVQRRDEGAFRGAIRELHEVVGGSGEEPFSLDELAQWYPVNPLCLDALRRAAEVSLSQTRSAVRLLQEAAHERGWLAQPAERLITPDVVFDVFRGEMALSPAGRRYLHAFEAVMINASRVAPGREALIATVVKALCVLGLGELRWSVRQLRAGLVGCEHADLWRDREALTGLLGALYRHGLYVERSRREGADADEYYVDVSSDASERIRQRLNELVKEMAPGDSRVSRAALEVCREDQLPLAGLMEPRSISVEWCHARRTVSIVCRDLTELSGGELQNLVGSLESPLTREDGWLFVASPLVSRDRQEEAWRRAAGGVTGRFARGLMAWFPRELTEAEREHFVEHAALSRMVNDPTVARPRDRELRAKLRERWEDSATSVRRVLKDAFHAGTVVGAEGHTALETQRLESLRGHWDESLSAIFGSSFRALFPHFASIAPERRLASRAQTNQIIDQFVRPGEVTLPPASALEANLAAYAAPLGLVEGEGHQYQLALRRRELMQAAVAAAPERRSSGETEPDEVIAYDDLAGRLGKSEWGMTREQCELLIATLMRMGYLVGLDAFLQPVRLEVVAAPLGDNLPYVMRGAALDGSTGEVARGLLEAAVGAVVGEWDLPAQERAWSALLNWAAGMMAEGKRAALGGAAEAFGHSRADWGWAEEALGRAEAVARSVDATLTSWQGLARLVAAAEAMPGGLDECRRVLETWGRCERFLRDGRGELEPLCRLVRDERIVCASGSLLAREREAVARSFAASEHLVQRPDGVRANAQRWLESYRRHYLAWHNAVNASARFGRLVQLRQSAAMDAAQRLERAGIANGEVERVAAEVAKALGQRCLTGDPLPPGWVVCSSCGLRLGQEVALPDADELAKRVEDALVQQIEQLRGHEELLRRRLSACGDERVVAAVEKLCGPAGAAVDELRALLSEDVIAWIRAQLGQPRARRRELAELESALRGREMTKREVVRRVEEWLGGEEDEVVEVV